MTDIIEFSFLNIFIIVWNIKFSSKWKTWKRSDKSVYERLSYFQNVYRPKICLKFIDIFSLKCINIEIKWLRNIYKKWMNHETKNQVIWILRMNIFFLEIYQNFEFYLYEIPPPRLTIEKVLSKLIVFNLHFFQKLDLYVIYYTTDGVNLILVWKWKEID